MKKVFLTLLKKWRSEATVEIGRNDYTTGNLLDYEYFLKN